MQRHKASFTELGLPHDKHRFIEVDIFPFQMDYFTDPQASDC
jgi:hypothetical protein